MFYVYLDVLATRIFLGQIIDYTRDPMKTALMQHPRNHMVTVMDLFKTRDIANPGRRPTKDTTDRDTC